MVVLYDLNSDRIMSEAECNAILDLMKSTNRLHYAIFYTLAMTGIRVSELCDLKWGDINLDAKTMIIRHGKGDKKRVVIFTEPLKKVLFDLGFHITGRVFKGQKGTFTRMAIHNILKKYLKILGLRPEISCHSFRHYYAIYLLNHGASLPLVQKQLGHSNIVTTSCYLQYTKDYAQRLEKILKVEGETDDHSEFLREVD